MSVEEMLQHYNRIKDSISWVTLPEMLQCRINVDGCTQLPLLSSYQEDTETLLKYLFSRNEAIFNKETFYDLQCIATAQLVHLRSFFIPAAPCYNISPAQYYVPISDECFVRCSFEELVAIYLYKAMPGQMPRPSTQMAATAQAAPRAAFKYMNNTCNPQQAGMAQQQAAVHVQGQDPLTASMLAQAPLQEQKQMLGERLFPLIQGMYPDLAGKITGMLLEIDNSELLHMLESRESLKAKVEEAVAVLQAHQAKEAASAQAK